MAELYRLDFASGKSYIGITRHTAAYRFEGHRRAARRSGKGVVYNAWRKHGEPTLTVLATLSESDMLAAEKRAIVDHGTRWPNGYNFTDGGDTPPSLDKAVAAKISAALKGRKLSQDQIERLRAATKGRKHTAEAKVRMSLAQRGKEVSELARGKMAAAKRGTKATGAVRAKMSAAQQKRRALEGCTPQRWRYPGVTVAERAEQMYAALNKEAA